jgi:hypothetical protein
MPAHPSCAGVFYRGCLIAIGRRVERKPASCLHGRNPFAGIGFQRDRNRMARFRPVPYEGPFSLTQWPLPPNRPGIAAIQSNPIFRSQFLVPKSHVISIASNTFIISPFHLPLPPREGDKRIGSRPVLPDINCPAPDANCDAAPRPDGAADTHDLNLDSKISQRMVGRAKEP